MSTMSKMHDQQDALLGRLSDRQLLAARAHAMKAIRGRRPNHGEGWIEHQLALNAINRHLQERHLPPFDRPGQGRHRPTGRTASRAARRRGVR